MNVFKLKDGLGNQLFQYAASKMLEKHGPIAYDISFYESDYNVKGLEFLPKDFLLPYFVDDLKYAEIGDRPRVAEWEYDPNKEYNEVWFYGDWQKTHYFKDLSLNIHLKEECISDVMQRIAEEMQQCNSVAVHVRRTDYGVFNWFLPQSYYVRAEDYIRRAVDDPVYYIFADDIGYVKTNPPVGGEKRYIHTDPVGDFWLMSQCKHQIIANSTYSFWAAYLNEHKNSIIVYPYNWVIPLNPLDWVRNNWKGV